MGINLQITYFRRRSLFHQMCLSFSWTSSLISQKDSLTKRPFGLFQNGNITLFHVCVRECEIYLHLPHLHDFINSMEKDTRRQWFQYAVFIVDHLVVQLKAIHCIEQRKENCAQEKSLVFNLWCLEDICCGKNNTHRHEHTADE